MHKATIKIPTKSPQIMEINGLWLKMEKNLSNLTADFAAVKQLISTCR